MNVTGAYEARYFDMRAFTILSRSAVSRAIFVCSLAVASNGCDSDEPSRATAIFAVDVPAVALSLIELDVEHPTFHSPGSGFVCRAGPDFDTAEFDDSRETMHVTLTREGDDEEDGIVTGEDSEGPVFTIFSCDLQAAGLITEDSFTVTVVRALDSAGQPLRPPPEASVFILPDADNDDEEEGDPFRVVFGVTNSVGTLGALQFNAQYLGENGGFGGSGGGARCFPLIPAALASFNDVGAGMLRAALIDLDGIPTPGDVAQCTFSSTERVAAGDFLVSVVDATNVEGRPPLGQVHMAVTHVDFAD